MPPEWRGSYQLQEQSSSVPVGLVLVSLFWLGSRRQGLRPRSPSEARRDFAAEPSGTGIKGIRSGETIGRRDARRLEARYGALHRRVQRRNGGPERKFAVTARALVGAAQKASQWHRAVE